MLAAGLFLSLIGSACADRSPFERGCEEGDADACHTLGEMMLKGIGGPRSKKKAEKIRRFIDAKFRK